MDARNRARWGSVAVLAVVFASGTVVGLAWDRPLDAAEAGASARTEESAERGEAGAESEDPERRRRRPMYEQVEPSEAQLLRIDSIMEAYRADVRTFHRESRTRYDEGMRALVVQTREAIKGVLDPDQAARYDSLTAARDARVREREAQEREERGGGGGESSRQDGN